MLDSFEFLKAMQGVREEDVRKAQKFLGYGEESRPGRHVSWKLWSAGLAAAILLSLFTVTAYALGLFRVEREEMRPDASREQSWIFLDQNGNEVSYWLHESFAQGFSLRFDGEKAPHRAQFRPGWLPQEPSYWWPGTDISRGTPRWESENGDWYEYLLDEQQAETDFYPAPGEHDMGIPYLITVNYAHKDHYLVFNGACEVVKHETWEQFEVYELACKRETRPAPGGADGENFISPENYVLLFSLDDGYVINIGGTSDLETLEHIARELEVRTTGEVLEFDPELRATLMNIALG